MLTCPMYGMVLKVVFKKLVMKYMEKRKAEAIMEVRGGGMRIE